MAWAFKDLANGGPALLISPARLPSREGLLRWVTLLIPVRLILFARSDRAYDISTLQAARELELGMLIAPGLDAGGRLLAQPSVRSRGGLAHHAVAGGFVEFPDADLRQWQVTAERRRPQLQQILKRHLRGEGCGESLAPPALQGNRSATSFQASGAMRPS